MSIIKLALKGDGDKRPKPDDQMNKTIRQKTKISKKNRCLNNYLPNISLIYRQSSILQVLSLNNLVFHPAVVA